MTSTGARALSAYTAVLSSGFVAGQVIGGVLVSANLFLFTERTVASRDGDPLLSLSVFRAPGLLAGLLAVFVLMVTYGGWLFSFALDLQGGLGDSAMRGAACSPRRSSLARRWGSRCSAACS
jgi:hypothetical protein